MLVVAVSVKFYYHYLNNEKVKIIAVEAAGKGINSGESAATIKLGKLELCTVVKHYLCKRRWSTEPYSISVGLDYPGIAFILICRRQKEQNLFQLMTEGRWIRSSFISDRRNYTCN